MAIETFPQVGRQPEAEVFDTSFGPPVSSVPLALRPSGDERELILIEITSAKGNIFKRVYRSTCKGDEAYGLYLQAKQLCLTDFEERKYVYPMTLVDRHDAHSVFFFSRQKCGDVNGLLRVCFDSGHALPMAASIADEFKRYRQQHLRMAEPGRFSLEQGAGLFSRFMSAIYQLAVFSGVQCYLLQVRAEHSRFYKRVFGAESIASSGAPPGCVNLCWDIERTADRFFKAFGNDQSDLERLLADSKELA